MPPGPTASSRQGAAGRREAASRARRGVARGSPPADPATAGRGRRTFPRDAGEGAHQRPRGAGGLAAGVLAAQPLPRAHRGPAPGPARGRGRGVRPSERRAAARRGGGRRGDAAARPRARRPVRCVHAPGASVRGSIKASARCRPRVPAVPRPRSSLDEKSGKGSARWPQTRAAAIRHSP